MTWNDHYCMKRFVITWNVHYHIDRLLWCETFIIACNVRHHMKRSSNHETFGIKWNVQYRLKRLLPHEMFIITWNIRYHMQLSLSHATLNYYTSSMVITWYTDIINNLINCDMKHELTHIIRKRGKTELMQELSCHAKWPNYLVSTYISTQEDLVYRPLPKCNYHHYCTREGELPYSHPHYPVKYRIIKQRNELSGSKLN